MSENEKLSTTLKAGVGYDAPWLVVHANSVHETGIILDEIADSGLGAKAAAAAARLQADYATAKSFPTAAPVVEQPAQQVVVQPQQQAAPPLQIIQPPVNTTPNNEYIQPSKYGPCAHGAPVWKDFTSKAGKPIKGWFCPSRDRTDCPPDFRN